MEGIFEKFYGEKEVDKSIREIFFADYSYHGTFLEVGAAGPEFLSMSKHYRENGWRVIAVEPNPDFCKLHMVWQKVVAHEYLAVQPKLRP